MKKTLYTLDIDYPKDITDLTYPYMERYAKKIGADFLVIDQRKYPEYPLTYEKLQLWELGKKSDWNIFIDADCLIHPDAMDLTNMVSKDTVLLSEYSYANTRFTYDNYFKRDNRNIAVSAWMMVVSDMCLDMFHPLEDMSVSEASKRIYSGVEEKIIHSDRNYDTHSFAIDEYVMSRNIARYGLKVDTIPNLLEQFNKTTHDKQAKYYLENFFHHNCWMNVNDKSMLISKMIAEWRI